MCMCICIVYIYVYNVYICYAWHQRAAKLPRCITRSEYAWRAPLVLTRAGLLTFIPGRLTCWPAAVVRYNCTVVLLIVQACALSG